MTTTNPNASNNIFKQIAQETVSISPLAVGREKITTEDLAGYKQLTIIGYDFATIVDNGETKAYPVIIFKELPDRYYTGGTILNRLCSAWTAEFDGDCQEASIALEQSGGVAVRFITGRTRDGSRNLTKIELV